MIVLVNKLHGVILAWSAMTRGGLVRMESAQQDGLSVSGRVGRTIRYLLCCTRAQHRWIGGHSRSRTMVARNMVLVYPHQHSIIASHHFPSCSVRILRIHVQYSVQDGAVNRLYRLYRRCNGVYSLAQSADRPYVSPTSQFVHAQNAPRPDSRFHLQGSSPT